MKNTMKIKSLLSFFVPAAMMSLMVASCSDYDNGYDTNAIKFNEEFRKAYGDIDPEQDWNLAERGTVTVSTQKESEVKIYALRGDEYVIVGDYEGIIGTQMLGFDMVEGTTNIMVTDGETAEQTVPGGVVTFGGTRTVYKGNETVVINKITNPSGLTLEENGVTYPMYLEATQSDYDAMKEVIPEIGWRNNYTNLNKVTHDFTYVSNGTFIVYPYYWETSSNNTIGIYYYANGSRQEVDLYTIKAGDEFQYATAKKAYAGANGKVFNNWHETNDVWAASHTSGNATVWYDFNVFTWTERSNNVVGNLGLPNGNLVAQGYTKLFVTAEMKGNTDQYRVIFYNNQKKYGSNGEDLGYQNYAVIVTQKTGTVEIDLSTIPSEYLTDCREICLAGGTWSPASNTTSFKDASDASVIGDVEISEMFLLGSKSNDDWQNYSQNFCSEIYTKGLGTKVRGQGIVVNIPEGTKFGMYLKKTDSSGSYTFYSQGDLNEPGIVGCGVTDNGTGTVTDVEGTNPCYASTFHVGNQMFLGFEDWPNVYHQSDFDLNDVVFAFDGCKPTIINEDPTPGGTWLLVCEDLGGSFDTDYNDVIFKVEHLSGQEFASVTAMAAGGTLASYIFFRDPTTSNAPDQCLGEIHQLFNEAPEVSGAYTPINVGYNGGRNRAERNGNTVTIQVSKDWTMAYYQADQFHKGDDNDGVGNYENVNMGGFEIRTLESGTSAPTSEQIEEGGVFTASATNSIIAAAGNVISAPDKGSAPYILCLPYTYKVDNSPEDGQRSTHVWSWPLELNTICSAVYDNSGKYHGATGGAYTLFGGWVSDSKKEANRYWYKTVSNDNMIVSPLILSTEDMQGGNGGGNDDHTPKPNPITNNGPLTIMLGTGVDIRNNLTNVVSSGEITWSITPANTAITNQNYYVPTNAGLYTITATQAAVAYNSNQSWITPYEAGSTSFTLRVYQPEALSCVINGKTYYLAWQEKDNDQVVNKLVLREGIWGSSGKWLLEPSGVGDYYYLKNLGNGKYLSVENGSGYYAKWLDTPDQMSRFMILSDGRIHRYNATNRFLGYYTDDDNALRVDANAGASGGSTAITFERESQDNAN